MATVLGFVELLFGSGTLLGSGTTAQDIAVAEAGRDAVLSALKSSKAFASPASRQGL